MTAYGVCYICSLRDCLVTMVVSHRGCASKDADRFTRVLHQAFEDMRGILITARDSKL